MVKSRATIQCTDIQQLAFLAEYQWSVCNIKPTLMLTNNMRVVIDDGFHAENFENALTGVAIDMSKQCPKCTFGIEAQRTDNQSKETLTIEYCNGNITVHAETESLSSENDQHKSMCTYSIPRDRNEQ